MPCRGCLVHLLLAQVTWSFLGRPCAVLVDSNPGVVLHLMVLSLGRDPVMQFSCPGARR